MLVSLRLQAEAPRESGVRVRGLLVRRDASQLLIDPRCDDTAPARSADVPAAAEGCCERGAVCARGAVPQ
jgi:hypothetical protein